MKLGKLILMVALACLLVSGALISCGGGDDDDDDGGDGGGWSCSAGCSAIYDDCNDAIYLDGTPLTEGECVEGCEELGGVDNCLSVCLDNFEIDEDCEELGYCLIDCYS